MMWAALAIVGGSLGGMLALTLAFPRWLAKGVG